MRPKLYRGGHYPHAEKLAGGTYRATCYACDWKGEPKQSQAAAERDWNRNRNGR